jgi:hypothetical protein
MIPFFVHVQLSLLSWIWRLMSGTEHTRQWHLCAYSLAVLYVSRHDFRVPCHVYNIVTNGRVACLTKRYGLFGLDTGFIVHLLLTKLMITIYCMALLRVHTVPVYIALSLFHTQSTVHYKTHWVLLVLCSFSPWVPASHGGGPSSCVPKLSLLHWLTMLSWSSGSLSSNWLLWALFNNCFN